MVELSKMDALNRQIDTAIEIFFNNWDIVSFHTLSWNSRVVALDLAKKHKLNLWIHQTIKIDKRWEFERKIREPKNFFKHAEKDFDEKYFFNPDITEYLLYDAIYLFSLLNKNKLSKNMNIFNIYFYLNHQEILEEDFKKNFLAHNNIFEKINTKEKIWKIYNSIEIP